MEDIKIENKVKSKANIFRFNIFHAKVELKEVRPFKVSIKQIGPRA